MLSIFNKTKIPYSKDITEIRKYEEELKAKTQEELIEYTELIKTESDKNIKRNKSFAVVNEAIKRTLGLVPYDVQLAGGISLSKGHIAQMRTGEGKTITALFPAFWGYIEGLKTYVVTVNEYLAERDFLQAQEVFSYLNIEVGLVLKSYQLHQKKQNYQKPIIYITNSEFAFDYLRDNIAINKAQLMQGSFDFAIIDEVDLVLIDEAKNPVIISGNQLDNSYYYNNAYSFVSSLTDEDYEIDEDTLISDLTDQGYDKAREVFGYEIIDNSEMYQAIRQCLLAEFKMQRDVDYIVRDGEVLIVNKFTGRVLGGRRFQDGLHQAIEAKEKVEIKTENSVLATTTYQNLFKKFKLLSGMTGTAIESAKEFSYIYNTSVEVIPTNRPVIREDKSDVMFKDKESKYEYLVELVKERHKKGQPILIGTTSVKESEDVVRVLERHNLRHNLLNAKNDKNEAEIVEKAGEKGAITIATNMAGRGTDIKISKEVEELGGLLVIGVSRNEALRIDRQLRGRSGRQGEAGESIFLTSLEDDLFLLNKTYEFEKFVKKAKNFPVTDKTATKLVDSVQNTIEGMSMKSRENQYKMDEIINYQREAVYTKRRNVLLDEVTYNNCLPIFKEVVENIVQEFTESDNQAGNLDIEGLEKEIYKYLRLKVNLINREDIKQLDIKAIIDIIFEKVTSHLNRKIEVFGEDTVNGVTKKTLLRVIDKYWILYLQEVEIIKHGIGFIAMGESDPSRKFAFEVDKVFKELLSKAKLECLINMFKELEERQRFDLSNFYTSLPNKDNYMFKLNMGLEELTKVKAVLYFDNSILMDMILEGKEDVTITIPKQLFPGMYTIKIYIDGSEVQAIKFKVLDEGIDTFVKTQEIIEINVPFASIYPVEAIMYRGLLTNPSGDQIVLDIPAGHNLIKLGKPEEAEWETGKYTFMLIGANLPIYTKEFIVE